MADKVVATTKIRNKVQYGKTATGFTLMEILISISLLAILAGFGLTVSIDSYQSYNFYSQQELLVSLLQRARAQAMQNVNQVPHGLHIDSTASTYTLFQGADFINRDRPQDLIFAGNRSLNFSGITDVVFTQLSGTTTAGSIIVKDSTHPKGIINLNDEGQINLQ
jgi:prepilin-type N-terminal cleavage/methylation domain-containing protein